MGVVYKARQLSLRRVVALKKMLGGQERGVSLRERFRAEAESVARLQHSNIVQIFEIGEHDGTCYFSLELVEGGSLSDRLKHGQAYSQRAAAQCVMTLAQAMDYAHQRGVVHRDLKPANILLTADADPKISDSAWPARFKKLRRLTRMGDVPETPSYMAPEQARGNGEAGCLQMYIPWVGSLRTLDWCTSLSR